MLAVLGKISATLERSESVNPDHLDQAIQFIKQFADGRHHAKEETLLFPAMESAGIPRNGGPIGVMLSEHEQGRKFVGGMVAASEGYRNGTTNAAINFARNARQYIDLLTEHISKEDNILFMMADAHLSPAKQQELTAEFTRLDQEGVRTGVEQTIQSMVDSMKRTYLP